MSPQFILSFFVGYFVLLLFISWYTGRNANDDSFFIGNRKSPWYIVAFGMVGASLSGVTFISIPGKVDASSFAYLQVVFGYMIGYLVIGTVLLPLYYRMNLTSIYTYLERRFGKMAYKTGAFYFLLSRTIGAAFRLYLVAMILQLFVFDAWGMPFWLAVAVTIIFIYIYTFRGGIRTIVWTDTLQTFFMLFALILSIHFLTKGLNLDVMAIPGVVRDSTLSNIFVWDPMAWNYFWKHFIGGTFIAIAMTGLDQDMMQKNLSCKNLKDAQKNMFWFSTLLFIVNILFLSMGALMFLYIAQEGIAIPADSDQIFPMIALEHFSKFAGIIFLLGLTAASYSSADSALTALTTSFCIDFLGFEKEEDTGKHKLTRYKVHILFSVILFIVIMLFALIKDRALIDQLFIAATYTYGPLLGLFAFGILSRKNIHDKWVLVVCILSPLICYLIKDNSEALFGAYKFGFEMLLINGALTYIGLHLIAKNNVSLEA